MKRILTLLLACCVALSLAACGGGGDEIPEPIWPGAEMNGDAGSGQESGDADGAKSYPVSFQFGGLTITGGRLFKDIQGDGSAATYPYKLVFDGSTTERAFSFFGAPGNTQTWTLNLEARQTRPGNGFSFPGGKEPDNASGAYEGTYTIKATHDLGAFCGNLDKAVLLLGFEPEKIRQMALTAGFEFNMTSEGSVEITRTITGNVSGTIAENGHAGLSLSENSHADVSFNGLVFTIDLLMTTPELGDIMSANARMPITNEREEAFIEGAADGADLLRDAFGVDVGGALGNGQSSGPQSRGWDKEIWNVWDGANKSLTVHPGDGPSPTAPPALASGGGAAEATPSPTPDSASSADASGRLNPPAWLHGSWTLADGAAGEDMEITARNVVLSSGRLDISWQIENAGLEVEETLDGDVYTLAYTSSAPPLGTQTFTYVFERQGDGAMTRTIEMNGLSIPVEFMKKSGAAS